MNYIKSVAEFKEAIKEGLVMIDFYADWCGPCKMLSPIIEDVANSYKDAAIYKLNVDNVGDVASALGIYSIPTIVFFKDGKEVNRNVGFTSKNVLISKLDALK
ncbi:MAG: thioredoxin [Bacilli bacterium]|nr:thioredoxin [Bacilli bacterium]